VHIVFLILNYSLLSSSKSLGRRRRRAAGQKSRRRGPAWVANNFFHGIPKKISFCRKKFSHELMNIVGGGGPMTKSRRRSPQIVGGGAAGAGLYFE